MALLTFEQLHAEVAAFHAAEAARNAPAARAVAAVEALASALAECSARECAEILELLGDEVPTLPSLHPVLAELARRPGWVVSRSELLRRVWDIRDGSGAHRDEHAVEATVARLRTALGPAAGLVKTVTKRGYRLAVEP